ncbi:LOW QUALITY PROTEIN: putative neural-cadherin 2 [Macrobrachium rosenbergii]|uniref:LOW QUALITY PROTEIN: putative neural-cadherin 2 n=1 Tax=Macrobrachium rosenbergii TaxID=79674 RepID=UPI0034D560AE
MDPRKIFQIITNSTLLATRLLSGSGAGPLEFTQPHYCAVLREDAQLAAEVLNVTAIHKQGASVRYSITGGNRDGLFTIDQHTGLITLAATLDYEVYDKHELVVSGEAGGQTAHTIVQVRVADVNDNPPTFIKQDLKVTVTEEDDTHLPAVLLKVEAEDKDELDFQGLLYTVRGDGVDGYKPSEAYFTINSLTGELIQQRALDRDPPWGKPTWKVRVQVRDGQALWSRPRNKRQVLVSKLGPSSSPKLRPNLDDVHERTSERWEALSNKRRAKNRDAEEEEEEDDDDEEAEVLLKTVRRRRRRRAREKLARRRRASWLKGKEASPQDVATGTESVQEERYFLKVVASSRLPETYSGSENRVVANKERWEDNIDTEMAVQRSEIKADDLPVSAGEQSVESGSDWKYIDGHKSCQDHNRVRQIITILNEGEKMERFSRLLDSKRRHRSPSVREKGLDVAEVSVDEKYRRAIKEIDKSSYEQDLDLHYVHQGITSVTGNGISKRIKSYVTDTKDKSGPKNPLRGVKGPRGNGLTIQASRIGPWMIGKHQRRDDILMKGLHQRKRRRMKREEDEEQNSAEAHYELGSFGLDGGCEEEHPFNSKNASYDPSDPWANTDLSAYGSGGRIGRVHLAEAIVTLFVKDVNDNPPVFPNATMFGEVQENGPIDLSVVVVSAWDADDANEGRNAEIAYSIEKNGVHETTGEDIFKIDSRTGLISTAVCCLDRESTPEYHIQVVATDGGGLTGSGTVIVRLVDVNDNSPRLAKKMWEVDVDETWGTGPHDNETLLEISVSDRDMSNYFSYRVVEESGWGWAHFGIRSFGTSGYLYALKNLDYEDEMQRKGFKFMIQVTDKGRGGWLDSRHLDSAWVKVHLHDLNDNAPKFNRHHAHVTVKEDTKPGTLLATLTAHDPDMGGKQAVRYHVVGGWGALAVDQTGAVTLWRSLDREAKDGAIGTAKIIAVDSGQPPLTSTATLTISVTDVNDCPPRLLHPTVFHVLENTSPALLGVLTATDQDVWALGHGPPFNLSLAASNLPAVTAQVDVKFISYLDSGRGGAEVWTKEPLDREQHRELSVGILLTDAGGLSVTQNIRIIVDDVNDNQMKPASKTVYLWKTQSGNSESPLGRVYVDDPDDWDVKDKSYHWLGQPHPLFSLNTEDGTIIASSQVREGRYELQFAVSDEFWGQRMVPANVTVIVRQLTQEALAHSTPIILTPATPRKLTSGWAPAKGGGILGRLIEAVSAAVEEEVKNIEVTSVYDFTDQATPFRGPKSFSAVASFSSSSSPYSSWHAPPPPWPLSPPSTCVWISVKEKGGRFINPVKLQGILGLHSGQLEKLTNLTVRVENPHTGVVNKRPGNKADLDIEEPSTAGFDSSSPVLVDPLDPSSAASRASISLPLQVVDANMTSLVTPRLTRASHCGSHEPETCTPASCLNGGRCIKTVNGNRCVCPGGSWGYQCKILTRTFRGSGFAWIQPLPSCIPTTISFRVLTRKQEAILLYAGPLVHYSQSPLSTPTPLLALQLEEGKVQMVIDGGAAPLKLQVERSVSDGNWHSIHTRLDDQGASLMIDQLGGEWDNNNLKDSQRVTWAQWRDPKDSELWFSGSPIQIGGLAHRRPASEDHGWKEAPISQPLDGCLSHLVINGQLMDLGEPALSKDSVAGCLPQESSCSYGLGACGVRGTCLGGLNTPECHCDPGWNGPKCSRRTVPARLGSKSYVKLALSFTPSSRSVSVQVRVRTRGRKSGPILHLGSKSNTTSFSLRLQSGIACASVETIRQTHEVSCISGRPLGDGLWHTLRAEFQGQNMMINVDDGDGLRQNNSLPSLSNHHSFGGGYQQEFDGSINPTLPFVIDQLNGVTVGEGPDLEDAGLGQDGDDLEGTCLDDLRISGHPIPLAPTLNRTSWAEIIAFKRIESGCKSRDACQDIACAAPLSCSNNWGRPICSCGEGRHLSGRTCEDIDECLWRPCLHGGSCYNANPGFQCVCGPSYAGEYCQWSNHHSPAHPLAAPTAIAAVTLSLLLFVFVGVFISFRLRRHWMTKKLAPEGEVSATGDEGIIGQEDATIIEVKGGTEEGGGGGGGGGGGYSCLEKDKSQEVILESLHLQPSGIQKNAPSEEKGSNPNLVSQPLNKESLAKAAHLLEGRSTLLDDPIAAKDDLRAYAYEGEGSSAGSLSSALSGLRVEQTEEFSTSPLVPAFLDVMDLLKNLPEATNSPSPKLIDQKKAQKACPKNNESSKTTMPPTPVKTQQSIDVLQEKFSSVTTAKT